jgi:DNA-binding GntR family transcriptional regulator
VPDALPRRLLRDQIREHLLDQIGSGTLAPGARIVEARICEALGVSSIPVREAIRELVTMGVLAAATHKGAWVREVSLQETAEALEVKAALEALAARLAAPALKENCSALRKFCTAISKAAKRRDFVAYQHCNQAFHRHIVEAANNAALLRTWSSLAFEVRTRFIMDFVANGDAAAIASEHEPIMLAFESGNAERAAELLATHAAYLIAYLQRRCAASAAESRPARFSKPERKILK